MMTSLLSRMGPPLVPHQNAEGKAANHTLGHGRPVVLDGTAHRERLIGQLEPRDERAAVKKVGSRL
jgi:hypothetical protein